MEAIAILRFLLIPLLVGPILFLIREKRYAPWIWVPASAWCLWDSLGMLMMVLMRNTGPGPEQWPLFGFVPLNLWVMGYVGLVGLAVWIGLPRKTPWRNKSWAGGLLILIGFPYLMWGLKALFGGGSGSFWPLVVLPASAPALVVTVLLFLLRNRSVAPWICVPVLGWSVWAGLSLLPTVLPRDPRYGPPQWNLFGYDALLVFFVLVFCGLVVIGALVCFPRKRIWTIKSWLGGVLVAFAMPLTAWLLFTSPVALQLIDPDGKPVAGAVVYRLKPGLGSRLPAVTQKTSDSNGRDVYRSFPSTDLKLLVPGNSPWITTELSIEAPREGFKDLTFRHFRQFFQSWGNGPGTDFDQALRGETRAAWRLPNPASNGRVGWMAQIGSASDPIPVYLHGTSQSIHPGLLEMLRKKLKETRIAAEFPSFIPEIIYAGYWRLLGQELRELHVQASNTNVQLESFVRDVLFRQAEMLAEWKMSLDSQQQAKGTARGSNIDNNKPAIGRAVGSSNGSDLEQDFSLSRAKVNEEARLLLEHIRAHPGTNGPSLADFESCLAGFGF